MPATILSMRGWRLFRRLLEISHIRIGVSQLDVGLFKISVHLDGLVELQNRLLIIPGLSRRLSQTIVAGGARGRQLDDPGKLLAGGVQLAGAEVGLSQRISAFRGIRVQPDSRLECLQGLFRLPLLQIDVPQGKMEFIVRRIDPDRLLIYLDRVGCLFQFEVGLAHVIISLGGIVAEGRKRGGSSEGADRAVIILLLIEVDPLSQDIAGQRVEVGLGVGYR